MSKSKEQFIKQRELEQRLEDSDYQYEQYLKQLYLNHNNKNDGKTESKKRQVQK